MTGKHRKSILDIILGDLKSNYAQVKGIEFHKVIEQIFHEDVLEEIFDPHYSLKNIDSTAEIITKIAFCSIPIKRRMALRYLCQYKKGMNSSAISALVGYETVIVKKWLNELLGLGVIGKTSNQRGEIIWKLKKKYVDIISKYENVVPEDKEKIGATDLDEMDEDQIVF